MAVISEDANPVALQLAVAHQAGASPGASRQEVAQSEAAIQAVPNVAVGCQQPVGLQSGDDCQCQGVAWIGPPARGACLGPPNQDAELLAQSLGLEPL